MPRVINRNYSTLIDTKTNIQFDRALDRRSGCYVALAVVDKKTVQDFEGRSGFEVLTDEEYAAMTAAPERDEVGDDETGDAVTGVAQGGQRTLPTPPKPPASN